MRGIPVAVANIGQIDVRRKPGREATVERGTPATSVEIQDILHGIVQGTIRWGRQEQLVQAP